MKAIGTAVTGGMMSATFIDLFYIPLLFVVVSRLFKVEEKRHSVDKSANAASSPGTGSASPPSHEMIDKAEGKQDPKNNTEGH